MKKFEYGMEYSGDSNRMKIDPFSDEYLSFLSCNGNIDAFDYITERYKNSLMNYVFYSVFDYNQSQEIVRETFIRLFRKQKKAKGGIPVSTTVFSIARKLVRKKIMRNKCESFFSNSGSHSPVETVFKSRVYQALGFLNISSREVIVLRDIEGMSFDEIAAITRMSVTNTKSRISEARRKLHDHVINTFPEMSNMQVVLEPSKQ